MNFVYENGSKNEILPAGQTLVASSYGSGVASLEISNKAPTLDPVTFTAPVLFSNGGASIGPYLNDRIVRIRAGVDRINYNMAVQSSGDTSAAVAALNAITATLITGVIAPANGGSGLGIITGIVKGNGTSAFSAATAGTDYSAGTASLATGIIKSTTTTGGFTIAVAGDFPTLNQSTTGNAQTATTADTPIAAGATLVLGKGDGENTLAHISAAGTTLHVQTGERGV